MFTGASTAISITKVNSDTSFINPSSVYCNPMGPDELPYYSQLNSEVPYYSLPCRNPAIYLGASESSVYVAPNNGGEEWGNCENSEVVASVYQEPNGTVDSRSEENSQYTKLNTTDYLSLYTPCATVHRKKPPVAPRARAAAESTRHEDPPNSSYQTLDPSKMQLGGPYETPKH